MKSNRILNVPLALSVVSYTKNITRLILIALQNNTKAQDRKAIDGIFQIFVKVITTWDSGTSAQRPQVNEHTNN